MVSEHCQKYSGAITQVGMQNSALGALLATLHFADPLTPVPCAISACMHSIVGSGIAAYWRLHDPDSARLPSL